MCFCVQSWVVSCCNSLCDSLLSHQLVPELHLAIAALQGLKLQHGHVPLYVRGDDANSKQFQTLHGVQRHMVDANKCKMVFDDNEEEYVEFYDWSKLLDELAGNNGIALLCEDTTAVTRALAWLLQ